MKQDFHFQIKSIKILTFWLAACLQHDLILSIVLFHNCFSISDKAEPALFFSKCCSRWGAGLIFGLPLVPNRVPAAALASFTLTQYEYYSPSSPDGVRVIAGTPPRTVFLHTGSPGNPFSYVFLTLRSTDCDRGHRNWKGAPPTNPQGYLFCPPGPLTAKSCLGKNWF